MSPNDNLLCIEPHELLWLMSQDKGPSHDWSTDMNCCTFFFFFLRMHTTPGYYPLHSCQRYLIVKKMKYIYFKGISSGQRVGNCEVLLKLF